MAKLIRAVNKMTINENSNTLICEQKLTMKFFIAFGIMAFALKKNEKLRTFDISQINEIRSKSSFMTGNTLSFVMNGNIHTFEMSSKKDWENCLDFLKTSKLSSLDFERRTKKCKTFKRKKKCINSKRFDHINPRRR